VAHTGKIETCEIADEIVDLILGVIVIRRRRVARDALHGAQQLCQDGGKLACKCFKAHTPNNLLQLRRAEMGGEKVQLLDGKTLGVVVGCHDISDFRSGEIVGSYVQ
jgi:hypothetical protein